MNRNERTSNRPCKPEGRRNQNDQPITTGEGILHHPEGIDLMPADIQLSGIEVSLVNAISRETILRQYLDKVKGVMDDETFDLFSN